jgi:hypothetical protein
MKETSLLQRWATGGATEGWGRLGAREGWGRGVEKIGGENVGRES